MSRQSLKIITISVALAIYSGHISASSNHDQTHPQQQVDGVQLFIRFCSQCHAPPAPMSRTAKEWPKIIVRMKQHMVTKGTAIPSNDQFEEITNYLQKHGG